MWVCLAASHCNAPHTQPLAAAAYVISLLNPPTDGSFVAPNLTQPQRDNLPKLRQLRQGLGTATANRWEG